MRKAILTGLARFVRDESGATMVEYGLMVGLIALVSIGIVTSLGISTQGLFQAQDNALQKALAGGS
jgi:pilus assembly protein Flp/PilA